MLDSVVMSACETCRGTGFEIVEKDGREVARRCACRRASESSSPDDLLRECRIPPRYRHCTFAAFTAGEAVLLAAQEKAL